MTPTFRAAATPDAAASSVTAGTSVSLVGIHAPDGPGPAAALNLLFEAEVAGPATAAPSGGWSASASDPPPSRFWLVLVDDDALWLLNPRKRITTIQVARGAL
jgi:hypothetical protein